MRKTYKLFLSIFILLFAGLVLAGCDKPEEPTVPESTITEPGEIVQFTVTFDANGGELTSPATVKVDKGSKVAKPTEPTREGYEFVGWYLSDDGVNLSLQYNFTPAVESDFTLYAKWEEIEGASVSISSILAGNHDNKNITVVGSVYFVDGNKVYISDSAEGKILVEADKAYDLSKKLEVEGKVVNSGGKRKVVATAVEEVGTEVVMPVSKTIQEVAASNNWYQYIVSVGTLEYNIALQEYRLSADNGDYVILTEDGTSELAGFAGERVELEYVLLDFDPFSNVWEARYIAGSIEVSLLTQAELEAILAAYFNVQVKTEILGGGLTLPATHPDILGLDITWESSIDEIEINNLNTSTNSYDTTITIPDADVSGVLVATVKYKDLPEFEIEINVVVQTLVQTTLEVAVDEKAAMSLFEAVVIGFAAGQNITFKSYIIQDLLNPSVIITVDYYGSVESGFGSYIEDVELGDILLFAASYRDSGRPTFMEVDTTKTGERQDPVYDFENAHVLNADTWGNWPGPNAFVKLENPYMRYSTSGAPGPTNWVRFGTASNQIGVNYGKNNNKTLAFLIRPLDELMGQEWRDNLGIQFSNGDGVMYEGDIYGFSLYESDTYFQFIAVSPEHFFPSHRLQVIQDLQDTIETRMEEGNLTLLTSHEYVVGDITWTSSHPEIIASNGAITYPENDTVVTLTATFTINNVAEEIEVEFEILVIGQVKVIDEVSAIIGAADGLFANVRGLVLQVAYTNSTTGGSTLDTIMLQDRTTGEILLVTGLNSEYLAGDIKIGDDITISGQVNIDNNNRLTFTYQTALEVNASDVELLDYRQNAIEVLTHSDAQTIFADDFHYGDVFRMRGKIYFNSTTTSGRITNLRFHLNAAGSALGDIQYGGKSLVFNVDQNAKVVGDNFLEDLFGFDTNIGTGRPGIPVYMDLYFIVKFYSDGYFYLQLVSADDVIMLEENEIVEFDIESSLPNEVVAGDITLPTTHALVDGAITWISDKEAIIANDGTVTYGTNDVLVTLTYSFKIGEETYTGDIEVTVKKQEAASVTHVIENSVHDDVVLVEGVVAGFHWNGSGTVNDISNGIILKDPTNNNVLYVIGLYSKFGETRAQYTVDGYTLAIGDKISFPALYQIAASEGHAGRQTLVVQGTEIEVISSNNDVEFDLTNVVEITDKDGLISIAENLPYGQIFKLKGKFGFRGSASSYGTAVNLTPGFEPTEIDDFNLPTTWLTDRPQRLSFKFDGNVPNLGATWWESLLDINADNYTGINSPYMNYDEDSYIYFMVGHALAKATAAAGYVQLVILDASWINVTRA